MSTLHTFTYSRVADLDLKVDVYVPSHALGPTPALVFFHGGGLVAGGRADASVPQELKDLCIARGWLFISADYRLLYPTTALDIVADVRALNTFLASPSFSIPGSPSVTIDPTRVAAGGGSGGGYMTRQFALSGVDGYWLQCRAVLLHFAQGGDLLDAHWTEVHPGHQIPFFGRSAERDVTRIEGQGVCANAHVIFEGTQPLVMVDERGRDTWLFYLMQEGEYLDVFAGVKGFAETMRRLPVGEERERAVSEELRIAFPQFRTEELPDAFIAYMQDDTVVPPAECEIDVRRLEGAGKRTEVKVYEGADHAFLNMKIEKAMECGSDLNHRSIRFLDSYLK